MIARWSGGTGAGEPLPEGPFNLAYSVHASTFHGQRDVQVQWRDFRPTQESAFELHAPQSIEVVDYRQHVNPLAVL